MPTIEQRVQLLEDKIDILEDILFSLGRALKLGEAPAEANWTARPGGVAALQTIDDILFTIGSYLADRTLAERVALGRGTSCPPVCPNPVNIEAAVAANARRVRKPKR